MRDLDQRRVGAAAEELPGAGPVERADRQRGRLQLGGQLGGAVPGGDHEQQRRPGAQPGQEAGQQHRRGLGRVQVIEHDVRRN